MYSFSLSSIIYKEITMYIQSGRNQFIFLMIQNKGNKIKVYTLQMDVICYANLDFY